LAAEDEEDEMKHVAAIHCIGLGITLFITTFAFLLFIPSPLSFGLFLLFGLPGFVLLLEGLAAAEQTQS
jgi:hypothetical protein